MFSALSARVTNWKPPTLDSSEPSLCVVRLTDGLLSIFAVAHRTRLGLLWFATRALFGHADRKADFVAIGEPPRLVVDSTSDSIEIALDGEVRRLRSPLTFAVVAGALKIVVPEPG